MKWLKYILVSICLACAHYAVPANPGWEHIAAYKSVADSEETEKIEVNVMDGYIYINTPKAVNVKIMSIVGQLISQQNVAPGVSRFKVAVKGIYILKAGDLTIRVNV